MFKYIKILKLFILYHMNHESKPLLMEWSSVGRGVYIWGDEKVGGSLD